MTKMMKMTVLQVVLLDSLLFAKCLKFSMECRILITCKNKIKNSLNICMVYVIKM